MSVRKLSPKSRRVLGAMAGTLVAADAPFDDPPTEEEALEAAADYIEAAPAYMVVGIRWLLLWLNYAAPLLSLFSFHLTWRTFLMMDPERRRWYLGEWDKSRFYLLRRSAYLALKSLILMAYFSLPPVLEALGYAPTCAVGGGAPGEEGKRDNPAVVPC